MSDACFCFVLNENRVMYVPLNTTSAVRQPAYRPKLISKSDGSRRNFDYDDLQILMTVFQTSAQKTGGHHLAMSLLAEASHGSMTMCRLLLAAGSDVDEREPITLYTRVS